MKTTSKTIDGDIVMGEDDDSEAEYWKDQDEPFLEDERDEDEAVKRREALMTKPARSFPQFSFHKTESRISLIVQVHTISANEKYRIWQLSKKYNQTYRLYWWKSEYS